MTGTVRVCVVVTPRLLHDLVASNLDGDGIEVTGDREPAVSVVTAGLEKIAHSKAVIVLGDSPEGDVRVLVDGEPPVHRRLDASELRPLVLDLADHVTRSDPSQDGRPRTVPLKARHRAPSTPAG